MAAEETCDTPRAGAIAEEHTDSPWSTQFRSNERADVYEDFTQMLWEWSALAKSGRVVQSPFQDTGMDDFPVSALQSTILEPGPSSGDAELFAHGEADDAFHTRRILSTEAEGHSEETVIRNGFIQMSWPETGFAGVFHILSHFLEGAKVEEPRHMSPLYTCQNHQEEVWELVKFLKYLLSSTQRARE